MKNTYKLLLLISIIFFFTNSCKKRVPFCSGNCETINATGKVINKLTATNAAGVPVSLSWVKFVGIFSQSQLITTTNSKSDGTFNFNATIDTSFFKQGYFLSLHVNSNNEYIILGYSGVVSTRAYSFDRNVFQGIQLEVYKKANLKIILNRIENDNFQSFSISHSNISEHLFIYDYNVQSPQEVIDRNQKELNIQTVADVFTRIKVVKTLSNGVSNTIIDSVKCTTSSTNVYNINF